jgi:hypothetical protein
MSALWDDRHPFVTAEAFRTSTCTGQEIHSLGGISSALAGMNLLNIREGSETAHVDSNNNTSRFSEDLDRVAWDDRRPFHTAKTFGLSIPSAAPRIIVDPKSA